ncbi:MAG: hypothetical protein EXX96DRAFT_581347 [Benjaminiella poitrasii]|nr:MAG: hypothetical protein EXX96DRAFT_581347 [Benjaminiella poitrasii]
MKVFMKTVIEKPCSFSKFNMLKSTCLLSGLSLVFFPIVNFIKNYLFVVLSFLNFSFHFFFKLQLILDVVFQRKGIFQ